MNFILFGIIVVLEFPFLYNNVCIYLCLASYHLDREKEGERWLMFLFIIFVILCHRLSTWSSVFTLCFKGLPLVVAFFFIQYFV